jgi:hypothetical protein
MSRVCLLSDRRFPDPRVLKSGASRRDFNFACGFSLLRIEAVSAAAAIHPPWPPLLNGGKGAR